VTEETPAGTPVTEEALKALAEQLQAQFKSEMDDRVKGFQRIVAEKDTAITDLLTEVRGLKTASMSEDELEQFTASEKDAEIERLRFQLQLNELSGTYGAEMPYFKRLLDADDAAGQLGIMREFATALIQASAPEKPAAPEATDEAPVPEVDLNRPRVPAEAPLVTLADGSVAGMTDSLADRLLASFPGSLASITQRGNRR
jgi:hypothetical protein